MRNAFALHRVLFTVGCCWFQQWRWLRHFDLENVIGVVERPHGYCSREGPVLEMDSNIRRPLDFSDPTGHWLYRVDREFITEGLCSPEGINDQISVEIVVTQHKAYTYVRTSVVSSFRALIGFAVSLSFFYMILIIYMRGCAVEGKKVSL